MEIPEKSILSRPSFVSCKFLVCVTLTLTVIASVCSTTILVSGASAAPSWGSAFEVPGLASLDVGNGGVIETVSCASAGNCSAGGHFSGPMGPNAFVVDEVNGVWRVAQQILSRSFHKVYSGANVTSISCGGIGSCNAVGSYLDTLKKQQVFEVKESNGFWGQAVEIPGTSRLNRGGFAVVHQISCSSARDCSAGGTYTDASRGMQAFIVSESHGVWENAFQVPGTASGTGPSSLSGIDAISCASAGNCGAGGSYSQASGAGITFVIDERHGHWGRAIQLSGVTGSNRTIDSTIFTISCASAGNCGAGGYYLDSSGAQQSFVTNESHGTWGKAIEVPGSSRLNAGATKNNIGNDIVDSISCASAGNCSATGTYVDKSKVIRSLLVDEVNGTWGNAIQVPGEFGLGKGTFLVGDISCWTVGSCSATGTYDDASGAAQTFIVNETNGAWGQAREASGMSPGSGSLSTSGLTSISCSVTGYCVAGGFISNASVGEKAYLIEAVLAG